MSSTNENGSESPENATVICFAALSFAERVARAGAGARFAAAFGAAALGCGRLRDGRRDESGGGERRGGEEGE